MAIRYIEDGRYDMRVLYNDCRIGHIHINHSIYILYLDHKPNVEHRYSDMIDLHAFASKHNWTSIIGPREGYRPSHYEPHRVKQTKKRWSEY